VNIKSFRDFFSEHPTPAPDALPKQFERAFAGLQFEIESADILDANGNPVHGKKLLENLASEKGGFRLKFIWRPFRQGKQPEESEAPEAPEVFRPAEAISDARIREAIEKLRRLELEAKLPFVALRYFRDRHLNGDHQLLRALKERGVLSFSKTENPNDPDHPTTTVRANRDHPLVKQVYDRSGEDQPQGRTRRRIQVQGLPLSQMITSDRR
jgi:hypothetical protein